MGRISCILSDFPLENILKDLKDFEPAELKKQKKKNKTQSSYFVMSCGPSVY
jgi:hypothetical protein